MTENCLTGVHMMIRGHEVLAQRHNLFLVTAVVFVVSCFCWLTWHGIGLGWGLTRTHLGVLHPAWLLVSAKQTLTCLLLSSTYGAAHALIDR
jgi:hypothetical protein